ncbi:hypothetical protein SAMN02745248_01758 [Hathewaya proteolytica DSM 3090]|uniref:Uncharacterized protein n=1 Tax=Hathewaya proteolytica DSM 3090 TaxID=1121331 RepID=A0A1M6PM05_9CLOT|nr:hypothetical protein [Hathewaya proteolytica]SHK08950.1 hypothetical protein SAMN02745248_01758 [Hathewaya proteolytica DSM 3090]
MQGKNAKILSGLIAAISTVNLMGSSVVRADVDVNDLYDKAYRATEIAKNDKTQSSINEARKNIRNLNNALKDNEKLRKQLVGTLSGSLDPLQHKLFVDFYGILYKKDGSIKEAMIQDDINKAREYVNGFAGCEENSYYIGAWSSAIDKFQGDNINQGKLALEKAKKTKNKEDIAIARVVLNDLLKIKHNDDMKKVIEGFDFRLSQLENENNSVQGVSLRAAGERILEVKFSKAVEDTAKVSFQIKKENIKLNTREIQWNQGKDVATIVLPQVLQDGIYSCFVSYADKELAKDENVVVKAAKISKIDFLNDYAVVKDSTPTTPSIDGQLVTTMMRIENQYGEDITGRINLSDFTISCSAGKVSSIVGNTVSIKDINEYKVGSKLTITVIHQPSGLVANRTFTVVGQPTLRSIVLGDVKSTDSKLNGKEIYLSDMKEKGSTYYIPLTVNDEYGNELSEDELRNFNVLSSNENIVKPKKSNGKAVVVTKDKKPCILLENTGINGMFGTCVITLISPNGVAANCKITVLDSAKVDVFTLEQPYSDLKAGCEITLPFAAVNQYGKTLSTADELVVDGNGTSCLRINNKEVTISATNATLTSKIDYAKEKKLSLRLIANENAKNVIITVVTATGRVQTLTFRVQEKPVATSILGIREDFYRKLQKGESCSIDGKIRFADQYGDEIFNDNNALWEIQNVSNSSYASNYNVSYNPSKKKFAAENQGTSTFKIVLKENLTGKVIDEYVFDMESVIPESIEQFVMADINKQYTGSDVVMQNSHHQAIKIHGIKNGEKVKINQKLIIDARITNNQKIAFAVDDNGDVYRELKSSFVDTNEKDYKATLNIIVEGSSGVQVLTQEVVYSSAHPEAKTLDVYYNGSILADSTVELSTDRIGGRVGTACNILNSENKNLYFKSKDQYNVNCSADEVRFYISNVKDGAINSGFNVTADENGNISIYSTSGKVASGSSFVINAVTKKGMIKSVNVVLNSGSNLK